MEQCTARLRPFPDDVELRCVLGLGHDGDHQCPLFHYAHPGSRTEIYWQEEDRRTFHGEWPGRCGDVGIKRDCVLPAGHHGSHAA